MEGISIVEEQHIRKPQPKRPNDPISLFKECQSNVQNLSKKMASCIIGPRLQTLQKHHQTIQSLQQDIATLENTLKNHPKTFNAAAQRSRLLQKKQQLIANIKQHTAKIALYKQNLRATNIRKDELEQQLTFKVQKQPRKTHARIQSQSIAQYQSENVSLDCSTISRKCSLPSLSPKISIASTKRQKTCTSSWEEIDKMMSQLAHMPSAGISQYLLAAVRKDKGGMNSLLRSFNINDKISEYITNPVLKQLFNQFLKLESEGIWQSF